MKLIPRSHKSCSQNSMATYPEGTGEALKDPTRKKVEPMITLKQCFEGVGEMGSRGWGTTRLEVVVNLFLAHLPIQL